ncbi:serine protease inhibitor [Cellulosimicrobium cellulans]|uniref:serpin family protein n=1 Tax=Cellulosimicrobium cellulans TaxID=1710 RepID=UPI00195C7812|nr:serpin family protein [Cellulosimicrobium cellulans]MBM7817654.1 serine protease inhibitor [Cellulosimicrobium cellulans]
MAPRTSMARTGAGVAAAAAVVGLVAACASGVPAGPDLPLATADAARHVVSVSDAPATTSVVEATDRLGLTMLDAAPREGNVVVSPASAVVALSMLAEGARGETAASLDAALGATGQGRTDAVNALLAALQVYDGDPALVQKDELPKTPLVHVANQVVLDDQAQVHDTYLEALATGYGAGVLRTDLGAASGIAPLSDWVRFHTGGLIEKSAIEPDVDLRLVLQNAVLFAARWEAPFDEGETRPSPFRLSTAEQVDVESLSLTESWAYAEHDGWRGVRLPYVDGFHADVVLPPEGTDPAAITPARATALREALDAATPQRVALTMPTLDVPVERATDLRPALAAAGLGGLFDPVDPPDLGGISDEDLFVSQAKQQAMLQVDAEGTVAAAVTELGAQAMSSEAEVAPLSFRVDRPYLFAVSHADTGWQLFTAAIRDPRH